MNRKKILMFINFFPPSAGGGVYRPLSFVKYLSRSSWDITVITPKAGGFWISDPGLEAQVPPDVRVIRTSSMSGQRLLGSIRRSGGRNEGRRSSSGFGMLRSLGEWILVPDTYIGWVPYAYSAASKLCRTEKFDAIYSTSPPDSTHLAARRLSKRHGIPWVADFRDPWISLYLRNPPTPLHRLMHSRMERSVARADLVIVTTDWQKETLEQTYQGCTVEKIPNGYDEEDFRNVIAARGNDDPFTILHCGMLTLGRTAGSFLRGLSLFMESRPGIDNDIKVLFAGAMESMNEDLVRRHGLENTVTFCGNIPHSECVELERLSDVLLLIKHDDERYRGLIPGKLYEYFGAGRPILAIVPEGEAARLISENDRGEIVSHGDPEGIAEALGRLYDLYRDGKLTGAYSLEELPDFSRRAGAAKLERLLSKLIRGPK